MRNMLKEYKERHPDNKHIKANGKIHKHDSDLSKGVFREEK